MPRTVSASEAKTQFGSIVEWTVECQDDVIVESRGKPRVVIMPFEEYEKLATLREETRRREALARLENLRERIQTRSQDLRMDEAEALADRLSRETIEGMFEQGKVRYKGP